MTHLYEESTYGPEAEPAPVAGQLDCARGSWSSLIDEAQTAIRVTLDELALLAGVVTAETVTHLPAAPVRSAYSLLLEPTLFRFPT